MDNLVQNRLFLQYLSGAGGAMSTGQPIGGRLDEITQQNISARSKHKLNQAYIKMMRDILKGGGDIKLGKDTTDIKIPSDMYGGLGSELARSDEGRMDMYPQGSGVGGIAKGLRDEQTVEGIAGGLRDEAYGPQFGEISTDRTSFLNPSASPLDDISGADLAGLTAGDVSQALSGAVGVQALKQKTLADIADANYRNKVLQQRTTADTADMIYKGQVLEQRRLAGESDLDYKNRVLRQKTLTDTQSMKESEARIMKMERPVSLDQPFVGGYSLREYNSLTSDTKEYILAKEGAKLLGDKEFMSQREWESLEPTERESFVRAAMKDPKLMEAAKELGRSEQRPLRRPLVTWTTATNELTKRFGKMDPTGMWAVTPELQAAHDKAQEFLVELKNQGMEPLKAVNEANKHARVWMDNIERGYHQYMKDSEKIKDADERERYVTSLMADYFKKYGYIPSGRR